MKRLSLILLAVVLLLGAGAGAGLWWLSTATLDVSRYAPRIAQALSTAAPGLSVSFGKITARRDPLRGAVEVVVQEAQATHPLLSGPAHVHDLVIDLELIPLLDGRVRVRSVKARGIDAQAAFSLAELNRGEGGKRQLPWAQGLRSVSLSDISLQLTETDRNLPIKLKLPQLAAYQNLIGDDVRLAGVAEMDIGGSRIDTRLKGTAKPFGDWHGDVRLAARDAVPVLRRLLKNAPETLPPLSLDLKLRQQESLSVEAALDVQRGAFTWRREMGAPLDVRRLTATANWREKSPRLDLRSLSVLVNGVQIRGQGDIHLEKPDLSTATASFDRMTVQQLISLWPLNAGPGGRIWVKDNIPAGLVNDGKIALARGGKLDFRFGLDKLTANYRLPMPPLLNASGTGVLTDKGLTLSLAKGTINGLQVTPATVVIEDWSASPNMMRVAMPMNGSLPALLNVLDSEPLGFITRYGVKPASTRGEVTGRVTLRFPLISALMTDEIEIKASARTRGSSVPDVYAGRPLTNASLDFDIHNDGMVVTGTGLVGPQPINLRWTEDFTGKSVAPSQYHIDARTSVATLALLDIDLTNLASGPLAATIDLNMKGGTVVSGSFKGDARDALVSVVPFNTIKAAGVAATVSGQLRQQGRDMLIDQLRLDSDPVRLRARARVPLADGRSLFEIDEFVHGRNRLSGDVSFGGGGPVKIDVLGGTLDAKPLMRRSIEATPVTASAGPVLRTEISGKIDSIEMLGDITLKRFTGQMTLIGERLQRMEARAFMDEAGETSISLQPTGAARQFTLKSADSGRIGKALGLVNSLNGGALDAVVQISGQGDQMQMEGRGRIRNVRLDNTPVVARMLTLASLTGIRDTAGGRGILFETVDVPFRLKRGVFDIREARATGPGLGVTLEGQLLQSLGAVNLRGVIIPSYSVNAILGKVPIVGPMLTGGKGQGLIGFNYRVTGPATEPKVDVQTASGLAIGPLRRLFQGGAAKLPAEPAKKESPADGVDGASVSTGIR